MPPTGILPGLLSKTTVAADTLEAINDTLGLSSLQLAPPMNVEKTFGNALGKALTSLDVTLRVPHQWAKDDNIAALSWRKVTALFSTCQVVKDDGLSASLERKATELISLEAQSLVLQP